MAEFLDHQLPSWKTFGNSPRVSRAQLSFLFRRLNLYDSTRDMRSCPPRSAQNRRLTSTTPVPGHPVYDLTKTNALPKLCCPFRTVAARSSRVHPPRLIRVQACRFHRAADRSVALRDAPTPARNMENREPQNAAAIRVLFQRSCSPRRTAFPLHTKFSGEFSRRGSAM